MPQASVRCPGSRNAGEVAQDLEVHRFAVGCHTVLAQLPTLRLLD